MLSDATPMANVVRCNKASSFSPALASFARQGCWHLSLTSQFLPSTSESTQHLCFLLNTCWLHLLPVGHAMILTVSVGRGYVSPFMGYLTSSLGVPNPSYLRMRVHLETVSLKGVIKLNKVIRVDPNSIWLVSLEEQETWMWKGTGGRPCGDMNWWQPSTNEGERPRKMVPLPITCSQTWNV